MKYCISCMEKTENDFGICPYCGFSGEDGISDPYRLKAGSMFENRYYIGKIIESDKFGYSYIAYDTIMKRKAVIRQLYYHPYSEPKEMIDDFLKYQNAEYFCEFYEKLASIYDVDFIQRVYTFKTNEIAVFSVNEYISDMTAEDYINKNQKIPCETAVKLILPTLRAISVIHEKNLYHGNLSVANLRYIRDRGFVICDFPGINGSGKTDPNELQDYIEKSRQDDIFNIIRILVMLVSGLKNITENDFNRRFFKSKEIVMPEEITSFLFSIPKKDFEKSQLSASVMIDYFNGIAEKKDQC